MNYCSKNIIQIFPSCIPPPDKEAGIVSAGQLTHGQDRSFGPKKIKDKDVRDEVQNRYKTFVVAMFVVHSNVPLMCALCRNARRVSAL